MINFDNVDDYVVVDNFMPKKFCKEYIEKSTKLRNYVNFVLDT